MGEVVTIAIKDLRLLVRDRVSLFFTLIFPVLFSVFFGAIFSSGGGGGTSPVAVMVVDEDGTPESMGLVERLAAAPELRAERTVRDGEGGTRPVTRDEAIDAVRLGRRAAAIVVPRGFGESSRDLMLGGRQSLELAIDPSRAAEAGLLEGVITKYAFEATFGALSDPERSRESVASARERLRGMEGVTPVRRLALETLLGGLDSLMADIESAEETDEGAEGDAGAGAFRPVEVGVTEVAAGEARAQRRRGTFAVSFAQGCLWGIGGCTAAFGLSLVIERSRGTLVRLRTAPLRRGSILAGKALACFVATMTVSAILLGVAAVFFGVRPSAPGLLVVALVATGYCFVGVMMLLAVLGRTEASAGSIGWAVILVMMMLGGGAVPLFVMPSWMQTLSMVSPVRWAILAIEGGLWRQGFTLVDMALPLAVLAGIGTLGLVIGVRVFDRPSAA